jgi:homoserine dehydrogenase
MLQQHPKNQHHAHGHPHAPARPTLPQAVPLRIGMLGLGTVGEGTWRVLNRNQALIRERLAIPS